VEQQSVVNVLRKQGRIAYVSSTQDNLTLVYDKETEELNATRIEAFSELLTKELGCVGLTSSVHDSNLYIYWLYSNGEPLDLYISVLYDTWGDPKRLCESFDRVSAIPEVQKVFQLVEQSNQSHEHFQFKFQGEDIHRAFIQALGMPSLGAFMGYYAIENAVFPKGLNRDNFIKTQD